MTKKSVFCKMTAIFFCILTFFSCFAISASAAAYGGSGTSRVNVTTKANYWVPGASSVTLKQDKQTVTYEKIFGTKTKSSTGYYGCYNISVYNVTKNKTQPVFWGGGQTKKITLDKDCTYVITVTYLADKTELLKRAPVGYYVKNISSPWWRVSSTWKVSSWF
ncbi:MAG: hypothetical protein ACI3W7_05470 [Oscillospiraceae bacterium]